MTFINAFTSSVIARTVAAKQLDLGKVADQLGYKSANLVHSWKHGGNIPPLRRLVPLADELGLPLEDLLIPWLCDQDPKHHARYQIMGVGLMGPHVVSDLLSGKDENSKTPWWAMPRQPMSQAWFVEEMGDAPPGSYPDNETATF